MQSRLSGASAVYPLAVLVVFQAYILLVVLLDNLYPVRFVMDPTYSNYFITSDNDYLIFSITFPFYLSLLLITIFITLLRWRELYVGYRATNLWQLMTIKNIFLLYSPLRTERLFST